jgi:hypothetical protein
VTIRFNDAWKRKANLERGETMATKRKKAGTEKAATSGKPKPKKKTSRGK